MASVEGRVSSGKRVSGVRCQVFGMRATGYLASRVPYRVSQKTLTRKASRECSRKACPEPFGYAQDKLHRRVRQEELGTKVARKKPRNRSAKAVTPRNRRRRGLLWGGLAALTLAVGSAYCFISFTETHTPGFFDFAQDRDSHKGQGKTDVPVTAQYVGSNACVSCHGKEASEWQTSQHHDAMLQANEIRAR